jgi:uncharacterized protein (UPF0210 family)
MFMIVGDEEEEEEEVMIIGHVYEEEEDRSLMEDLMLLLGISEQNKASMNELRLVLVRSTRNYINITFICVCDVYI